MPEEAVREKEVGRRFGPRSNVTFPIKVGGKVIGAMGFGTVHREREWPDAVVSRLRLFVEMIGSAMARAQAEVATRDALEEVRRLRDRLQRENVYLQQEVKAVRGRAGLIGESAALRHVLEQVEQVAATDASVLLIGETGTGKEMLASAIHELSLRGSRPMVRVSCAAIPETLIESELFGREKGAYTGAMSRQVGRFEVAHGSTLFLDEVGELPLELQVKLLRVLQEKQVERLGSSKSIAVDVRIIAATNRDLEMAVREKKFRDDLYYRLNVFPIRTPPLRERREDIPLLIQSFVNEFAKSFGKGIESIDNDSIEALQRYSWPGNIRELRNTVERAMILATGPRLYINPPTTSPDDAKHSLHHVDVEREHIRNVLESTGWRVRGKDGAAEILGLKPTTLDSMMVRLGLDSKAGRRRPTDRALLRRVGVSSESSELCHPIQPSLVLYFCDKPFKFSGLFRFMPARSVGLQIARKSYKIRIEFGDDASTSIRRELSRHCNQASATYGPWEVPASKTYRREACRKNRRL